MANLDDETKRRASVNVSGGPTSVKPTGTIGADERRIIGGGYVYTSTTGSSGLGSGNWLTLLGVSGSNGGGTISFGGGSGFLLLF